MTATRSHIMRTTDRSCEMNKIGQRERLLQLAEQLEHRRLHRHVEAGGRLVEHDEARMQRQDAREPDAALLPAGKLVRIEIEMRLRQADLLQDGADALLARSADFSSV